MNRWICGIHGKRHMRYGIIRDVVRMETDTGDKDGGSTSGWYCQKCRDLEQKLAKLEAK